MSIYYIYNIYSKGRVIRGSRVKYNTINDYAEWLEVGKYIARAGLAPSTAKTYQKAIDFLLKDQYITDCHQLNIDMVLEKLTAMKYKNQFSKYKNAFLKFSEFLNLELSGENQHKLDKMMDAKIKKRRKLKGTKLKDIQHKIRVMQDKKLKSSYETMLYTGLRVSELAQIKKSNCIIHDKAIEFQFIGKGGKTEKVILYEEQSKRIFNDLRQLIDTTTPDRKIFYSVSYLQTNALKKDFQCHDLRRAFAKLTYQEHKDKEIVMRLLRHSKIKNTISLILTWF